MLYRDFGNTGWQVSAIGMGTWNIGNQWGEIDEATALATVRSAFDNGVNLFDTAEGYGIPAGLSEERLGRSLKDIRDQVHIVTKIGSWGRREGHPLPKDSVDNIRLCAHASLFRLRTDWVDVMLCHEGEIEDPTLYLEAFELLKEQGLIRAYGISTNELDVIKRFNANNTCQVVELDYSLLNRKPESKILPYCQKHNIAVLVRGPLSKGLLSGKYSPETVFTDTIRSNWHQKENRQQKFERQMSMVEGLKTELKPGDEMITAALRYVTSHPVQPVAIPGAKSPEQAAMNARAGEQTLSSAEREHLVSLLDTSSSSSSSSQKIAATVGK
ncbi:MAG: aldo/keto reductase [Leptolyngbyaceae cyanobacterium RM2_2_4]|nr:aldo/keto reductase [Leptolyngbyaceae cyanobacterium SM1_4_3]NJO48379.1 aldo/keto reductase [Leptolyngbyaceae cyanobacterium RM2_2_4]